MGRKRSAISLSFSLTNETIEKIENMAKINDLNRSELMRIINNYLDKNPDKLKKILEGFEF